MAAGQGSSIALLITNWWLFLAASKETVHMELWLRGNHKRMARVHISCPLRPQTAHTSQGVKKTLRHNRLAHWNTKSTIWILKIQSQFNDAVMNKNNMHSVNFFFFKYRNSAILKEYFSQMLFELYAQSIFVIKKKHHLFCTTNPHPQVKTGIDQQ